MRVGLVSDTHGPLDADVLEALAGCQAVLHAGDIGDPGVLSLLARVGVVLAVRGNNDRTPPLSELPERHDVDLEGCRVHLVHRAADARPAAETRVVVVGHSHAPLVDERDGRLWVNPGAAGRVGFHRRRWVALLDCNGGVPHVQHIDLGPRRRQP